MYIDNFVNLINRYGDGWGEGFGGGFGEGHGNWYGYTIKYFKPFKYRI